MRPASTQIRSAGPKQAAASAGAGCHAKRTWPQHQWASARLAAYQGQHSVSRGLSGSALPSIDSAGVLSVRRTQPDRPSVRSRAQTRPSATPGENGASPAAGADTAQRASPRPAVSPHSASRACAFVIPPTCALHCHALSLTLQHAAAEQPSAVCSSVLLHKRAICVRMRKSVTIPDKSLTYLLNAARASRR